MDLHGKVALITGGARRVGRAITLGVAGAGADVVINYLDSPPAEAEAVAAEVVALGRRAVTIHADLSHGAEVVRLVRETADIFGRLDLLVNNASTFIATPFLAIE